MKTIIGIVPLWDDEKQSYWMLPGYMKGIEMAGGIPVILPMTDVKEDLTQLVDMCDGFLITGGHDIDPQLYGEEPMAECGILCVERDRMEMELLALALKADKAVLGICRGMQLMNTALGGSLYQDIPVQHPSSVIHHQRPPYHMPSHEVMLIPDSPLGLLMGKQRLSVNSCHHQGVKALSGRLHAMAAAEDGLIEAVFMPEKAFVWGVQWHPEFSYKTDGDSMKIFQAFLKAAGEQKAGLMDIGAEN